MKSNEILCTVELSSVSDSSARLKEMSGRLLQTLSSRTDCTVRQEDISEIPKTDATSGPVYTALFQCAVSIGTIIPLMNSLQEWAADHGKCSLTMQIRVHNDRQPCKYDGLSRFEVYSLRGKEGQPEDVDFLMAGLTAQADIVTVKIIDFALGTVTDTGGIARIRHYLFNGSAIQRNYAALFFKRNGKTGYLEEAVQKGCITGEIAFSK